MIDTPFPAVAPLVNCIVPCWVPLISDLVTKLCVFPELFAIPAPLTFNVNVGPAVIVNTLSPALNTMPFTTVLAERETSVVLEKAKVAVSAGPLGGPPAVQLIAVFQSPELGFFFQVALPASNGVITTRLKKAQRREIPRVFIGQAYLPAAVGVKEWMLSNETRSATRGR